MISQAFVAFAAAIWSCGANATDIRTLPPFVTKCPSFRAEPQWKTIWSCFKETVSIPTKKVDVSIQSLVV